MKRLFVVLMAFLVVAAPVAQSNTWTTVSEQVRKSILQVQITGGGACTGFVINDKAKGGKEKDQDVDYILTAAHCDGQLLYAAQRPATIRAKDVQKDLMVIEVEDLDRPAIRLAKSDPKAGDEVASFGYGYGLEEPMFRVANVANDKIYIPFDGVGGPLIAINATFVPGQSGGPVVNHDGELVMVVQRGTPIVGFGVGADTIRDKVGRFFGSRP